MTRHTDDLRALWLTEQGDVCDADELLTRVARSAPIARRRPAMLAIAAAVVVVMAVAATFYAFRPTRAPAPHGRLGHAMSTATASPTASRATAPGPTHVVDLGGARARVPVRWFAAPYLGEIATVYFPIMFLGTEPFTGECGSTARTNYRCTTQNWFPPGSKTPKGGVIVKWGHSLFPGGTPDRLTFAPGHKLVIDHRPAKLYAGPPTKASCPAGVHTQIVATVRTSTSRSRGGDLYDMTACLGPNVSAADTQAVYAMLSSLRITG